LWAQLGSNQRPPDYESEVFLFFKFYLSRCLFTGTFDFVVLFVYILLKQRILMVNEQESTKILNEGEYKFTHEEMLQIREFITTLAHIEFDCYKQKQNKPSKNERNLLQAGQYRRAS
jgi:hypothetical protein